MATLAEIRTDLSLMMRDGTLSSDLESAYNLAINMAIRRVALDRRKGVTGRSMIGETWGDLSVASVVIASVGDTTATIDDVSAANVYGGDIIDFNSNKWLIYDLNSDTVADLGSKQRATFSGTGTITRRTIELQSTGIVTSAWMLSSNGGKRYEVYEDPTAALNFAAQTGDPEKFTVAYDQNAGKAVIQLWPGPTASVRVGFEVTDLPAKLTANGSTLSWPDANLDEVLAEARNTLLSWEKEPRVTVLDSARRESRRSADKAMRGPGLQSR